jgi:hypothetical protein
LQYQYGAHFDTNGVSTFGLRDDISELDINRDRFGHTNGYQANVYPDADAGPLQRKGTWRFTSGLSYISVLQICQESRAETEHLIGRYIMLRLNPETQHVWFNPAKDSLMLILQVETTKRGRAIRPGFPVYDSIKDIMINKMFERMTERRMAQGIDGPEVALPDFFECSVRFWRPSSRCPKEWGGVVFHYFGRPGVKIFGMSLYHLYSSFTGFLASDRAPGVNPGIAAANDRRHITPPFIEIRDSSRPTLDNPDPELSMSDINFAWTGNANM